MDKLAQVFRICQETFSLSKRQLKTLSVLVTGILIARSIRPATIGRNLPSHAKPKHSIKRVERFLKNPRVEVNKIHLGVLRYLSRGVKCLKVAIDWTDLGRGYNALVASVAIKAGRTIPFAARVLKMGVNETSQNRFEYRFLDYLYRLCRAVGIKLILILDRGFARSPLIRHCQRRMLDFVLRLPKNWAMESESGDWIVLRKLKLKRGQTKDFGIVRLNKGEPVEVRLVCTWSEQAKEPWYIATSLLFCPAHKVCGIYAKRFRIEESFRDSKNIRAGFQMRGIRLSSVERWERLLALSMVAYLVTIVIGYWTEEMGQHRAIMANTSKKRTLSLFFLGIYVFQYSHQDIKKLWLLFGRNLKHILC